jgi:hypothetical protein
MESNWAADHLQTIRTLMERSALYRRALAPIMTFAGFVGVLAAAAGCLVRIDSPNTFILYWFAVGLLAITGSLLLVRRQALKDAEPFWSPPTRRAAQAILPALVAGFAVGIVILIRLGPAEPPLARVVSMLWLPLGWVVLYGCAMCAAGFFTLRGLKLFGWSFILAGCALFAIGIPDELPRLYCAHGIMGFFFGVLHIAYGAYLYLTEKGKNAS